MNFHILFFAIFRPRVVYFFIFIFKFSVDKVILWHRQKMTCSTRLVFETANFASHLTSYSQNAKPSLEEIIKNVKQERKINLAGLANFLPKIDFANSSSHEAIALLNCCGREIPNASNQNRNQTCQLIYQYLQNHDKITLDVFHMYVTICSDNLERIDYIECLKIFKLEPTKETYKLLLRNVCEQGDVEPAYKLLEMMKEKQIPVDEDVFNNLVLCHALQGGLSSAESILQTMKLTHIAESNATKLNLFKGLLRTKNYSDFKKALQKYAIRLSDEEFLLMLEYIGLTGNLELLKEAEFLFQHIILTHLLQAKIEDVCFHLIHMGQFRTALQIFEKFVTFETDAGQGYGEKLLKEILQCNTNPKELVALASQIRDEEKNAGILEKLTEFALRHGYVDASWELLNHIPVKCHYFWPLLVLAGKADGEKGIFFVLQKMKNFDVKLDDEGFEFYIFPYCNLASLKRLVTKFQEFDYTVKEIVNPLMTFLIKQSKVEYALDLCNSYNVNISHPNAGNILARSWQSTFNTDTIVKLLNKYIQSEKNDINTLAQTFLLKSLKLCRSERSYRHFLKLCEVLKSQNFHISFSTGNAVVQLLQKCPEALREKIKDVVNSMIDVTQQINVEEASIPHPRKMSTQDLECHLIELEEKGMETRGVIRRLIQAHSREGNLKRVDELRNKLQILGYQESPGMKSSIMHNYALAGKVDEALNVLDSLRNENPDFLLDSYKCIDLARTMVEHSMFEEALNMLMEESRKFTRFDSNSLIRNCRELLLSCTTEDQQMKMFEFLKDVGLCKPSTIILGPLIRTYLNRNDLVGAVAKYTEFAQTYRCTPLQRELFSAVSKAQNTVLLETVLQTTKDIHGPGPAQVGLISGLAECGQVKPLKKVLVQTNLVIKPLLERQCKRWTDENKVEPLLALKEAGTRLPSNVIDLTFLSSCILDIYGDKNDCDAILNFLDNLPEDCSDRPKLEKKVSDLLRKNNFSIPKRLSIEESNK